MPMTGAGWSPRCTVVCNGTPGCCRGIGGQKEVGEIDVCQYIVNIDREYVYLYVCVCVRTTIRDRKYVCAYLCMCRTYVCVSIYVCVCFYVCVPVRRWRVGNMYVRVYVSMYVRVYVSCMCVLFFMYVYLYDDGG